ncbi:peroxiredoxin [Synechococcus elongatus]|uniref:thioredoxin-dependent peroxiredoxin n=2 Tax=Synechococcus elongatus TaxID=32046 RepID=Q31LU7_SYNE7|nr:peroxiredoxin [Synechococcus elongatus]ABB57972.1 bacterioferritin comigratory protein-like [Synechococcus elongatus PCC 7942 = FACHB-805]AJD57548.1 alkyl hydroperoxide reductase [Synechococcus elongatus UTEX 2973]MBD2586690.1 peroxiredoxin [Synechococcus elongatus FACHB-242]MBD2687764.1 peroxiredoxin [Synechococcus elongatus FACHB-1061]MBD2706526.1 peroxiredoxin [Synechococcus elongatus PCC 7942 = FACHB-805]
MAIAVGDVAPDFSLPAQDGTTVSLSDFRGQKPVVLYFYPKDDTPGCTIEACSFRDSYTAFQEVGAVVLGVSSDSIDSHQRFAQKYNLPFQLLSDAGDRLRQTYGVPKTLFVIPGRVTYVIDKEGKVRHIFDSLLNAQAHIQESLNILRSL